MSTASSVGVGTPGIDPSTLRSGSSLGRRSPTWRSRVHVTRIAAVPPYDVVVDIYQRHGAGQEGCTGGYWSGLIFGSYAPADHGGLM